MKNSLYIAKISGIKIFIHWSFFILIIWIIISGILRRNNTFEILYSIAFILTIFCCVILHELGHALVAKRFHYKTKDIILLPIGGMARMDELPENPKQELLVAIAGPVVNVIIAGIVYPFIPWNEIRNTPLNELLIDENNFLFSLFFVNISLAVFNLIPAFPMDGGRVFRALLSMRMDRIKATAIAAYTGQTIAVLFFILGILFNPILALIAVFIFITAQAENDQVRSKFILQNYKVKDLASGHFHKLDQSATIMDAAKLLLSVQSTSFLIMNGEKIVGTLNRDGIIRALAEIGENANVSQAMNSKVEFVTEDTSLDKALKELENSKTTILPVGEDNSLSGVINLSDILELILVKTAIQKYVSEGKS